MNFRVQNLNINIPRITFSSNENKRFNYQPTNFKSIPNDSFELSVGYINDTHGQTNNMMRILSGIKGDLRLSGGDNDIGDEKNIGVHKATTAFLNLAKIRASVLGNHELDTSQADCINSIKNYNGEMLSINYKKDSLDKHIYKLNFRYKYFQYQNILPKIRRRWQIQDQSTLHFQ